jgi:hypothetical protein
MSGHLSSEDIQRQIIETIKIVSKAEAEKAVLEAIKNIDISEIIRKKMKGMGLRV